jgi:hypothetical protein
MFLDALWEVLPQNHIVRIEAFVVERRSGGRATRGAVHRWPRETKCILDLDATWSSIQHTNI